MANPIYSTSVPVSGFSGLNQSGDGHNLSMQYAVEMSNVSVEGGTFRQMREGQQLPQELTNPIGTLAYLHRRFGATGVAGTTLLVAISSGKLYTKLLDGSDAWVQRYPIPVGEGETEAEDPFSVDDCDWVTYEISLYPDYSTTSTYLKNQRVRESDKNYKAKQDIDTAESWTAAHWEEVEGTDPVDILIFSNAKDGMFCLYGDDLTVVPVATPKKFGVLARYNERIWGTGIEGDPDMLVYSTPFDPFNWEQNDDIPEDGAGDIMQPTWDGDSFLALRQFGSTLLDVKRNSLWRTYGTHPGEFQMRREYGGGTIVENSLVVHNEYAYMLGEHGIMRYDGTGVYPFLQDVVKTLMHDKVNHDALDKCCAAMRDQTYCLALPINGSEFCNAVLEYNTLEKSFALRTEISVETFLQIDERLFYTSATQPGRVFEMRDDVGKPLFCEWISGWQDLGQKNSIKSAFILYMMVDSEAPVDLRVGIRTEKKLKTKIIQTKPGKMSRLHLNLQGRVFRLEIRSYSAVPFTIAGGLKIDLELDPD
jgi:hypothetical protein